jgi:hypothetical protein
MAEKNGYVPSDDELRAHFDIDPGPAALAYQDRVEAAAHAQRRESEVNKLEAAMSVPHESGGEAGRDEGIVQARENVNTAAGLPQRPIGPELASEQDGPRVGVVETHGPGPAAAPIDESLVIHHEEEATPSIVARVMKWWRSVGRHTK